jgi:hypothetical protein
MHVPQLHEIVLREHPLTLGRSADRREPLRENAPRPCDDHSQDAKAISEQRPTQITLPKTIFGDEIVNQGFERRRSTRDLSVQGRRTVFPNLFEPCRDVGATLLKQRWVQTKRGNPQDKGFLVFSVNLFRTGTLTSSVIGNIVVIPQGHRQTNCPSTVGTQSSGFAGPAVHQFSLPLEARNFFL